MSFFLPHILVVNWRWVLAQDPEQGRCGHDETRCFEGVLRGAIRRSKDAPMSKIDLNPSSLEELKEGCWCRRHETASAMHASSRIMKCDTVEDGSMRAELSISL